jgi:hypothetical protein
MLPTRRERREANSWPEPVRSLLEGSSLVGKTQASQGARQPADALDYGNVFSWQKGGWISEGFEPGRNLKSYATLAPGGTTLKNYGALVRLAESGFEGGLEPTPGWHSVLPICWQSGNFFLAFYALALTNIRVFSASAGSGGIRARRASSGSLK